MPANKTSYALFLESSTRQGGLLKDGRAGRTKIVARDSRVSRFDDIYLGLSLHVPNVYTPNRPSKAAFPTVTSAMALPHPLSTLPLGDLTPSPAKNVYVCSAKNDT